MRGLKIIFFNIKERVLTVLGNIYKLVSWSILSELLVRHIETFGQPSRNKYYQLIEVIELSISVQSSDYDEWGGDIKCKIISIIAFHYRIMLLPFQIIHFNIWIHLITCSLKCFFRTLIVIVEIYVVCMFCYFFYI